MWREQRIVVKHLAEPGLDAVRISFWVLHRDEDIDRVAEGLSEVLTGAVTTDRSR
jgi:selenocysteine lyase/cysteine desulfurase